MLVSLRHRPFRWFESKSLLKSDISLSFSSFYPHCDVIKVSNICQVAEPLFSTLVLPFSHTNIFECKVLCRYGVQKTSILPPVIGTKTRTCTRTRTQLNRTLAYWRSKKEEPKREKQIPHTRGEYLRSPIDHGINHSSGLHAHQINKPTPILQPLLFSNVSMVTVGEFRSLSVATVTPQLFVSDVTWFARFGVWV